MLLCQAESLYNDKQPLCVTEAWDCPQGMDFLESEASLVFFQAWKTHAGDWL